MSLLQAAETLGQQLYRILPMAWRERDHSPETIQGRAAGFHERFCELIGSRFGTIRPAIDDVLTWSDPDHCPEDVIPYLSEQVGWPLPGDLTEAQARFLVSVLWRLRDLRGTSEGIRIGVLAFCGEVVHVAGPWARWRLGWDASVAIEAPVGSPILFPTTARSDLVGARVAMRPRSGETASMAYVEAVVWNPLTNRWELYLDRAPAHPMPVGSTICLWRRCTFPPAGAGYGFVRGLGLMGWRAITLGSWMIGSPNKLVGPGYEVIPSGQLAELYTLRVFYLRDLQTEDSDLFTRAMWIAELMAPARSHLVHMMADENRVGSFVVGWSPLGTGEIGGA